MKLKSNQSLLSQGTGRDLTSAESRLCAGNVVYMVSFHPVITQVWPLSFISSQATKFPMCCGRKQPLVLYFFFYFFNPTIFWVFFFFWLGFALSVSQSVGHGWQSLSDRWVGQPTIPFSHSSGGIAEWAAQWGWDFSSMVVSERWDLTGHLPRSWHSKVFSDLTLDITESHFHLP